MGKFYDGYYSELHEKTKAACECIETNNSTKLLEQMQEIYNMFVKIDVSEWEDTAGDEFRINQNEETTNLSIIIDSINSTLKKSEKYYIKLNILLNDLEILDYEYEIKFSSPPDENQYQDVETYNRVYNEWESEVASLSANCEKWISLIEECLTILENINQAAITGSECLLSSPLDIPILNLKFKEYEFNGSDYMVLQNFNYNNQVINDTYGKQDADGCHKWCYNVMDDILNLEKGSYVQYRVDTEEELLEIMQTEFLAGRPAMLQVNGYEIGTKYSRHFVVLGGMKKDVDSLQQSNFLIIDPATPEIKPLATPGYHSGIEEICSERFLLDSLYDYNNPGNGYVIYCYVPEETDKK